MKKFCGRYRTKSLRASWWNYAANGLYFITICTAHRIVYSAGLFIACLSVNPAIAINPIGEIVHDEWEKSFQIRQELYCDAFVIMPDQSFVAGFKSPATRRINEYRRTPRKPVWQSRFHDRIIRNRRHYKNSVRYIHNNPAKWIKDKK